MFENDKKDDEGRGDKGYFLPGNKFWHMRKKHGGPRIFETPDDLEAACMQYFDWVDENPLYEAKAFGSGLRMNVPKARAMTIHGLCIFIGIGRRTWDSYRDREEFKEVIEMAESVMFDQKFAGAAAGFFSAAIIARDLGLADKTQVETDLTVEVVDRFGEDNNSE